MKVLVTAFSLMFASSLISVAEPKPSPTASSAEFKSKAKEVAEMEKQLALAMEKRDTAFLERVLAGPYFDVFQGDKRAMNKAGTIARCKAGLLNFLVIVKEPRMSPERDLVAVEGLSKHRPVKVDDLGPEEQWVHVRRLWEKKDGKWLLTSQIRRLEGDDGKGEVD